ncbi:hypothetical protein [Mesorhizobium jarvisii]|uniref:hypothetical protein n=1 Tax=Mesorhizobium jarvisii TaxID=1777867 RepID=UPI0013168381|nr:hypothetical protein [Mesorhizobium jarvisii]AID31807.2 hypothetical protein MCHK_4005 [Mesorhizobium huakuii 7653R]MCH4561315.1 hypothetical protein [Mesorhizobium jarvisii]
MARTKPSKQLSQAEIESFLVAAEALHKSIVKPLIELCWNLGDEADQAALCGFNSMTSIPSWNLAPAMSFGN